MPCQDARFALIRTFMGLESDAQTELQGARLPLSCRLSEEPAGKVRRGRRQVNAVEQVEDLATHFQSSAFRPGEPRNANGLDRVDIHIGKPRTLEGIPAEIALLSPCRNGEVGGLEEAVGEITARSRESISEGRGI